MSGKSGKQCRAATRLFIHSISGRIHSVSRGVSKFIHAPVPKTHTHTRSYTHAQSQKEEEEEEEEEEEAEKENEER